MVYQSPAQTLILTKRALFWPRRNPFLNGRLLSLPGFEVFWASMVASFGWARLLPFGEGVESENDRDINN